MSEIQKQIHEKIEKLFHEVNEIHESKPEEAKQKISIALNMIKIEFKKLKLI